MKKLLCAFLTLTMFYATPVMANDNITVKINNETINFDVAPQIINGMTYVPMRTIFEKLGATVEWNDLLKTINSKKDNTNVRLVIGENKITVNGKDITLNSPAKIVNGKTLVPVRAVAESFNCDVKWDNETKIVSINTIQKTSNQSNSSQPMTTKEKVKSFTEEQKEELWQLSTKLVRSYLKAPSTAIFTRSPYDSITFMVIDDANGDDLLIISGDVDSQNAFGAMLRDSFDVGMNCETGKVKYVTIGSNICFYAD